ncbi:MAG TPA: adenylate/guanylate cyclase domain-containing protein [Pseudonocardia sp.]|jgi:adenylate cyclase
MAEGAAGGGVGGGGRTRVPAGPDGAPPTPGTTEADAGGATAVERRLENTALGGPPRYRRAEVAELAGVPLDRAQTLWRSLGFPTAADDDVVFTDADVDALRAAASVVAEVGGDSAMESSVARALGQHLSRLAEGQVDIVLDVAAGAGGSGVLDEQGLVELADRMLPQLERIQSYVWRRHLLACVSRAVAAPAEDAGSRATTVGFADIVGYTRLSRGIGERELAQVLERFESAATEIIGERGGRIVKMIGDEVFFVCDHPGDAAEIGLSLVGDEAARREVPPLRVGMASGSVVHRVGDVYGAVVNLAARLTSTARPSTVLLDESLAALLADDDRFALRTLRPVAVRGYRRMRPTVLRRAHD